jgi:hypothetical protein
LCLDCQTGEGEDSCQLAVSKRCSEPFRAMFGPEWREGTDLRGWADLVEITLPEDDATAVQLLCAVIHHRNIAKKTVIKES